MGDIPSPKEITMKLSPEQHAAIQTAIDREIQVQQKLSQARDAATNRIAAYFESKSHDDDSRCPDQVRIAIQFTARPFHPLHIILRAAARIENTAPQAPSPDAESPVDQPAPNRAARRRAESSAARQNAAPYQTQFKRRKARAG